jgi:hypothetical protein
MKKNILLILLIVSIILVGLIYGQFKKEQEWTCPEEYRMKNGACSLYSIGCEHNNPPCDSNFVCINNSCKLWRHSQESSSKEENGISSNDCGDDLDCFIEASKDCELSSVNYTVVIPFFEVNQTTTSSLEVKGMESNKCIFYIKTEKIELDYPSSVSQETVDEQKAMYKNLEGRDGTCKFDTKDLTDMLTRWNEGKYSTKDWDGADCTGDYFNQ